MTAALPNNVHRMLLRASRRGAGLQPVKRHFGTMVCRHVQQTAQARNGGMSFTFISTTLADSCNYRLATHRIGEQKFCRVQSASPAHDVPMDICFKIVAQFGSDMNDIVVLLMHQYDKNTLSVELVNVDVAGCC